MLKFDDLEFVVIEPGIQQNTHHPDHENYPEWLQDIKSEVAKNPPNCAPDRYSFMDGGINRYKV